MVLEADRGLIGVIAPTWMYLAVPLGVIQDPSVYNPGLTIMDPTRDPSLSLSQTQN